MKGDFVAQGLRAPGKLWKRLNSVQCGEKVQHPHMQRAAPFMASFVPRGHGAGSDALTSTSQLASCSLALAQ